MKAIFFTLLLVLFFSCQSSDAKRLKFVTLEASGKSINTSYDFCSVVAIKHEYSYRINTWKFIVNDSIKIAEGPYINTLVTIDDHGGCPYSFFTDSIAIEKWSFWDLKGNRIPPNQRLKNIITSKDTLWAMIDLSDSL